MNKASHAEQTADPAAEAPLAGDHAPRDLPPSGPTLRGAMWLATLVVLVLLLGGAAGMLMRRAQARALESSTADQARLFVITVKPKAGGSAPPLTLPGTLQGFVSSPIYARSSGYVLRWTKDIGSPVKKGDVLAEIDTPEVDQQLSQAQAARDQLASSLALAKSSSERWEELRRKDAVSQQELDERKSTYTQAQANLAAADANVRRLQETRDFKRVVAPFAGTVTQRNVDVGDLVDPSRGRALFMLSQVDPLRVYVYVPQTYAQAVKVGQAVAISQAEMPGQTFTGQVARSAGAIDATTRTLQIEISLPNPDGRLLPGAYVQVSLPPGATAGDGAKAATGVSVPTNSLLFRPEGVRVAVVGADNRVALRPVTIGRDDGNTVQLLSGVTAADAVVLNPPDALADHDLVTVVAAPGPAASAASGAQGAVGAASKPGA